MSRKVELLFALLFLLFFLFWLNFDLLVPLGVVNKKGPHYCHVRVNVGDRVDV